MAPDVKLWGMETGGVTQLKQGLYYYTTTPAAADRNTD